MKSIFVDTNILVDLIGDRKPFSKYAVKLFAQAEGEKVKLFVSSHSIVTTHYLMKKYVDDKTLKGILLALLDFVTVIPVTMDMLKKGLRSNHKDYEDVIQMLCAGSIPGIEAIVTRNMKDFRNSDIKVIPPDELDMFLV